MNHNDYEELLIDEDSIPNIKEDELVALKPFVTDFVNSYVENNQKPVDEWLFSKMQSSLPEKSDNEIHQITNEIIDTIKINELNKTSLNDAISKGRSKEAWFASKIVCESSSIGYSVEKLQVFDYWLEIANEAMRKTITNKDMSINKNPNLGGLIAEQYHVQTFNLNARATGCKYRAVLHEQNGKRYAKNSVDTSIKADYGRGKVDSRYQLKYCKDAKATVKAFEKGDYRGQQKLVPDGQELLIGKKATNVMKLNKGTNKSNPISKERTDQMAIDMQNNNFQTLDWNEYQFKGFEMHIGKSAGYAGLQGIAIGTGWYVAEKLWTGEEIKSEEVIETALTSGVDFGIKAATAGAIKVASEKGIFSLIPKGTPASMFANIAHIAIENVKIAAKVAKKELTVKEGLEKMEQTTVSVTAGLVTMSEGAAWGALGGLIVLGPVGAAIGGFVGGTVGYMAGSKLGETIVKCAQKVRDVAVGVVKKIGSGIKNFFNKEESINKRNKSLIKA